MITNAATTAKVLAALSATRWQTAGTIAKKTGLGRWAVEALMREFYADELVDQKPHDCSRMTFRLAA